MQQNSKTHQSLERALHILLAFKPYNRELGTSEISAALGIHKSTTSRLLAVLRSFGFVQQNPRNKKYSLGASIADLGAVVQHSLNTKLTSTTLPYLEDLRDRIQETVVLEIPYTDRTVVASVAEGLGPVRIKSVIGDRNPYHTSAGSKAILAFAETEMRERVISEGLPPRTPHSITEPDRLIEELRRIRKNGYAFDQEENNLGICAVGVPIFNWDSKPAGAIVVAGSAQNINRDTLSEFLEPLRRTARLISSRLSFNDSAVYRDAFDDGE